MLVWSLRRVICLLLCDSVAFVIFVYRLARGRGRHFFPQIRERCNLQSEKACMSVFFCKRICLVCVSE